jgi:hypothetical protein
MCFLNTVSEDTFFSTEEFGNILGFSITVTRFLGHVVKHYRRVENRLGSCVHVLVKRAESCISVVAAPRVPFGLSLRRSVYHLPTYQDGKVSVDGPKATTDYAKCMGLGTEGCP